MVLSLEGSLTSDIANAQKPNLATEASARRHDGEEQTEKEESTILSTGQVASSSSLKRPLPDESEFDSRDEAQDGPSEPKAHKVEKVEEGTVVTCTAPPLHNDTLMKASLLRKHVYLEDGWRDRLCRCEEVS